MNLKITFLVNSFNSILFGFFTACAFENESAEVQWNGNLEQFDKEFSFSKNLEAETMLTREADGLPFSGLLVLTSEGTKSVQGYLNGKLNGKSIKQNNDGSYVEAYFQYGEQHGEMKFYDSSKKLRSTILYENGKLKSLSAKK
jgi:antitoxin component YwqK of YwqJK toxin-antitoxin module